MFYLKFLWLAVVTNFKLSLALRFAFFITMVITIVKQLLFLVAWNFFFEKYKVIQGWNFNNMILMYGIVGFSIGCVETFFYGLRDLARIIDNNQLDTFLLQPKNVILNIAMSKGDLSALGEIVTGVILIIYSGYLVKAFPVILLILLIGILFVFSLFLYLGCIGFFMRDAYEFVRELSLNAIIIATQPNAAYRGAFKILTFTVLPVAFLSFFPIEYLRTGILKYLFFSLLGTTLFLGVAWWVFYTGLKRYESGNMIVYRH